MPNVGLFPSYELQRRSHEVLESMRACMRENRWGEALRIYFDDARQEGFVNWVVYVDRYGRVFQAITEGERKDTEYRGEKYVWTLLFMDRPPTRLENGKPKPFEYFPVIIAKDSAVLAARRSVNYQRDPLLGALFKFVVGKFLSGGDPGAPSAVNDSIRPLELRRLPGDDSDTMYVAQTRFGLAENTQVVLSLAPGPNHEFPGQLRSVYANLGNAAVSRWEVGISAGASFGPAAPVLNADTIVTGTAPPVRPNIYLMSYLNLYRPKLPWRRRSFGLTGGMNLVRGSLLDEVVTGMAFGRLISDAGLIVGASWVSETRAERSATGERLRRVEKRVPRTFLAFDFRL